MRRLENKVAFITGAARGMGRAHAVRLAQEGARHRRHRPRPGRAGHRLTDQGTLADLAETARLAVGSTASEVLARTADVRDLAALEAVDGRGR